LKIFNIAVYISGSGSNFKAVLDNTRNGYLNSTIKLVVAGSEKAGGLQYAHQADIKTAVLSRKDFASSTAFGQKQLELLHKQHVDLIILAGYMKKLSPQVVRAFKGKILNIHPALLPKFGGKGMYGMNVHKAVIEQHEKKSGATIHFVDEIYDNGHILLQREVDVAEGDTAELLQQRVLKVEHELYSEAIRKLEQEG